MKRRIYKIITVVVAVIVLGCSACETTHSCSAYKSNFKEIKARK